MTVERLREIMATVGTDPTARELADVLWLAYHLGPRPEHGQPLARPEQPREIAPVEQASASPAASTEVTPETPAGTPAHAGPTPLFPKVPATTHGEKAFEVPIPAAVALGDRLGLQRALRPLGKRITLPWPGELDELATAERIAAQRPPNLIWQPTWKPALERWFDCAVVIDAGSSMLIWRQLADEVFHTIQQAGLFRKVQCWQLAQSISDNQLRLVNWCGTEHPPMELVDPAGRRLILVISDCVGAIWHSGAAPTLTAQWAGYGPVAILQPLPERLWGRTAAPTLAGTLTADYPGAPNSRLSFVPFAGLDRPKGTAIPMIEISTSWLRRWANVVAATRPQTAAVAFFPGAALPSPKQGQDSPAPIEPLRRVRQFRSAVSPEAFRLARYVAFLQAASLPVIQHIHQAMFHRASPAHLAEFLLSGLLQLRDAKVGAFEFVPEVPSLLLDSLTSNEALRMGRLLESMVSESVEARIGVAGKHFLGLAKGAGVHQIANADLPFAVISGAGSKRLRLAADRFRGEAVQRLRQEPPVARSGASADLRSYHLLGGELLSPQAAVAPFVGREKNLSALRLWATGAGPAIRLLVGPAGVGKTRLAKECIGQGDEPVTVIDNADQLTAEVLQAQITTAISEGSRLLLTARSAGEWWEEQRHRGARGLIRTAITDEVGTIPNSTLRPSMQGFAAELYRRAGLVPADLQATGPDGAATPLEAQMRVLEELIAAFTSPVLKGISSSALSSVLISHRRYWERTAISRRLSYRSVGELEDYVAAAALYGADSIEQAVTVCRAVGADKSAPSVAAWIHDLYPGAVYWGQIGPDAIREALLVSLGPRLNHVVAPLTSLAPSQQASALWTLTRLAALHRRAAEPTWQAIRHSPGLITMVWRASEATGRFPSAMIDPIRRSVLDPQIPVSVLNAIISGLGDQSVLFAGCPMATAERLLGAYRRLSAGDVSHQRALANTLGHVAAISAATGRPESIAAAEEGVRIRRRLTEAALTADSADRAGLHSALSDLVEYQARFGFASRAAATAVEAVAGLSRPVENDMDPDERLERIARHGRLLAQEGHSASARSSFEVVAAGYRRLSQVDPAAHRPRLAAAILELSSLHRLTGNASLALDASSEAAVIFTQLAADDPARYRLAHADAVLRLGVDLGETGSPANAQACILDAVNLYRLPADGDPQRRSLGIALAQYMQALQHNDLGNWMEALEVIQTAIAELRDLAAASHRHRTTVALILTHQAEISRAAGLTAEAIVSLDAAVSLYRQIQTAEPLNAEISHRLARCVEARTHLAASS